MNKSLKKDQKCVPSVLNLSIISQVALIVKRWTGSFSIIFSISSLNFIDSSDNAVDGVQISQCHSQITWSTCRSIRNLLRRFGPWLCKFLARTDADRVSSKSKRRIPRRRHRCWLNVAGSSNFVPGKVTVPEPATCKFHELRSWNPIHFRWLFCKTRNLIFSVRHLANQTGDKLKYFQASRHGGWNVDCGCIQVLSPSATRTRCRSASHRCIFRCRNDGSNSSKLQKQNTWNQNIF